MEQVIIPRNTSDLIEAQFEVLYNVFKDKSRDEDLEFDLSQIQWVHPLVILPISAYINDTHSKYILESCKISTYLDAMKFPQGVDSIDLFRQAIISGRSYIPITVFRKATGVFREKLEAMFQEKIAEMLGAIKETESAITYPISELVTNIFEHSKKDIGFICAQIYRNKNYLDICIVDRGRGITKAYEEEKKLQLSDEDALRAAMRGESTKPNLESERGFGIQTSKNIICEALEGQFILISGAAGLLIRKGKENLIPLPEFYWQGTIVAFRITKPLGPIDIYKFLH